MASDTRLRVSPTQPPEGMESLSDTASKAGKARRPGLLSFDEMPAWFRRESNQWILRGYRPISGSAHASFCSWSYIHNESVNIYSHLIPAVFFLLGEWRIQHYLVSRYSGITGADFIAFSIFMLSAVTCLSLSATYHTLMNHSQHVERLCLRLDMLGVVIFILGDLILGIYMIFWCEPLPRNIYWSMVSWSLFAQFCYSLSQTWYLSLTLFFPRLIDWSFWDVDHLHDNASQVPGLKVSPLPSIDVRGDRIVRWCALDPWTQCVRHDTDDDKSFSLYSGQSSLPSIWNLVLCSKSPNFAHKREDPNTCGSEDQVSRKSISRQIRPLGLPFDLPHSGGMRRCGPVDGLS